MEAGEYGLTRGTCFVARSLKLVTVAGLLWISWCVFWVGRICFRLFQVTTFSNPYIQSSQRRLGEGAPTASQSAYRDLVPTYPHQVHRIVCSHLRNLASAVDQYSSSQPCLTFDPTSATSTSFFQASRAPVAFAREKEHSGRHTREGYRRMCSDPVNPGGEVRGCSVACELGMSDVLPFVRVQPAGPYREFPYIFI